MRQAKLKGVVEAVRNVCLHRIAPSRQNHLPPSAGDQLRCARGSEGRMQASGARGRSTRRHVVELSSCGLARYAAVVVTRGEAGERSCTREAQRREEKRGHERTMSNGALAWEDSLHIVAISGSEVTRTFLRGRLRRCLIVVVDGDGVGGGQLRGGARGRPSWRCFILIHHRVLLALRTLRGCCLTRSRSCRGRRRIECIFVRGCSSGGRWCCRLRIECESFESLHGGVLHREQLERHRCTDTV